MTAVLSAPTALHLLQALSFVWAGLVLGISFLEAPVKFRAPRVTREIGLDVGRHVFLVLNRVELGLAAVALGLLVAGGPGSRAGWTAGGIGTVLLLQTAWLLPVLRAQASAIIAGDVEHGSEYVHTGYVLLEALKVAGLLYLGWQALP